DTRRAVGAAWRWRAVRRSCRAAALRRRIQRLVRSGSCCACLTPRPDQPHPSSLYSCVPSHDGTRRVMSSNVWGKCPSDGGGTEKDENEHRGTEATEDHGGFGER